MGRLGMCEVQGILFGWFWYLSQGLSLEPRLASNSQQFPCLCFLIGGIISTDRHD